MALKVGDTREQVVIENVNRSHIVKYAGASGDFNPLHHDEGAAQKMAGYPSVFAHGMLSMGLTGRMLTDWLGPTALKKYGVGGTLSGMDKPGLSLTEVMTGQTSNPGPGQTSFAFGLPSCTRRAKTSLPEPVSPHSSTGV